MPIKWKLFGIVNYLLILFYTVVFVFAMKAFLNPQSGMRHLQGARLITLCILVIVLNAGFNIYIFHRHLPAKPPDRVSNRIYRISTLLYTLSFAILSYYFVPNTIKSLALPLRDPDFHFMLLVALMFLLTLFVLIIQYSVLKFIDKKYNAQIANQISDLGNENKVD